MRKTFILYNLAHHAQQMGLLPMYDSLHYALVFWEILVHWLYRPSSSLLVSLPLATLPWEASSSLSLSALTFRQGFISETSGSSHELRFLFSGTLPARSQLPQQPCDLISSRSEEGLTWVLAPSTVSQDRDLGWSWYLDLSLSFPKNS